MEEGVKAMKGYSIWTLLAIMTLLAVWMAIPRKADLCIRSPYCELFFAFHQLTLWTLVADMIWLTSGKKFWVMGTLAIVIFGLWGPITVSSIEEFVFNTSLTRGTVAQIGLSRAYGYFYHHIFYGLGYADFPDI